MAPSDVTGIAPAPIETERKVWPTAETALSSGVILIDAAPAAIRAASSAVSGAGLPATDHSSVADRTTPSRSAGRAETVSAAEAARSELTGNCARAAGRP